MDMKGFEGARRHYNAVMNTPPRSVAEIGGGVDLLRAACDAEMIIVSLQRLLEMPDARCQGLAHTWVTDLLIAVAPSEFRQAVACLIEDTITEQAYAAIFQCQREAGAAD